MRLLNSVYVCDHQANVRLSKGSLLVSRETGTTRVPLEAIDSVVVIGGAAMTIDAISACVARGIRVSFHQRNGKMKWAAGPPTSGNVNLRTAQHALSRDPDRRLTLCRILVAGKLQNSRRVVRRWARDADIQLRGQLERRAESLEDRLGRLISAPTEDHVRGIEGDAARTFFSAVGAVLADGHLQFLTRNRRPPRDPINAMMGFSYTLLTTETKGALEAVGLDPQLGFLHAARPGRPALALDMIEELRPIVDRFIVGVTRRTQMNRDHFITTPGGAVYLTDDGRAKFLELWEEHKNSTHPHRLLNTDIQRWAIPQIQATLMARHIRGDLDIYSPFLIAD